MRHSAFCDEVPMKAPSTLLARCDRNLFTISGSPNKGALMPVVDGSFVVSLNSWSGVNGHRDDLKSKKIALYLDVIAVICGDVMGMQGITYTWQ